MQEKMLAKISKVRFGIGGYQDCQFGLFLTFEGESCGIGTSKAFWDYNKIKRSDDAKWSESDRDEFAADLCRYMSHLLDQAKCEDISELKGKPVELTLESFSGPIKSWRILTEVL